MIAKEEDPLVSKSHSNYATHTFYNNRQREFLAAEYEETKIENREGFDKLFDEHFSVAKGNNGSDKDSRRLALLMLYEPMMYLIEVGQQVLHNMNHAAESMEEAKKYVPMEAQLTNDQYACSLN